MLVGCLPGALFAWPALRPRFAVHLAPPARRLLQLFHSWAWVNLLFWALVPGHRPRHALPLQPALAGLATLVWAAWAGGQIRVERRLAVPALLGLFLVWGGVRLTHANWLAPRRDARRKVQERGQQLAALLPSDQPIYLFRLKDDGIIFYSRHAAKRLRDAEQLPKVKAPLYCLLCEQEWQNWPSDRRADFMARLADEGGNPLTLIRTQPGCVSLPTKRADNAAEPDECIPSCRSIQHP
jgi:hypothetical protein